MSQPNLTEDLNIVANSNLEITMLDGDLNIIQALDDEPNDVGGLTSAELKAKFDEAGNTIKTYINGTLIPEILTEEATEAARAAAEEARSNAEAERQSAEEARASAEQTRVNSETARVSAEQGRVSAENARTTAEQAREAAEQARADETSGIVARATAQANVASSAAESAGDSAAAAANSKSAAASSASSAAGSAAAASTSETNAKTSETAAKASENAAKASETAAKESETKAKSEADRAKSEADRAAGIVGGDYATKTDLSAHTDNAGIHVTAEEKAKWNDSDVFIAEYGTTTYGDILSAYNTGKRLICKDGKKVFEISNFVGNKFYFYTVGGMQSAMTGVSCHEELDQDTFEYVSKWEIALKASQSLGNPPKAHASTHASGGTDPITPASIGASPAPKSVTVTLAAASWDSTAKTQTVTVTGVKASETAQMITPIPALASQSAYYDAGILCTGQAADSLIFTADTVPTEDFTVYVTIQEVTPI